MSSVQTLGPICVAYVLQCVPWVAYLKGFTKHVSCVEWCSNITSPTVLQLLLTAARHGTRQVLAAGPVCQSVKQP